MVDLLSTYSLRDIFLCIVLFAIAVKGLIEFMDWIKERTRKWYQKDTADQSIMDDVGKKLQDTEKRIEALESQQKAYLDMLNKMNDNIDLLIRSDKDDIKAYIVSVHHQFCKQKWIDTYSLECCERRYEHYKDEGGNSFIAGFMEDLRSLPNEDPNINP
jgi:hypothetical protein